MTNQHKAEPSRDDWHSSQRMRFRGMQQQLWWGRRRELHYSWRNRSQWVTTLVPQSLKIPTNQITAQGTDKWEREATYIAVGLDLQWGPGRCPGKWVWGRRSWSHFVNCDVLENEYTKKDISCTSVPIKNVTLAFLRAEFFRGLKALALLA